jgi:hypothetical protein
MPGELTLKSSLTRITVFAGLVTAGVAGRFLFPDIPNFTPTTALVLFAGFYFASRWTAMAVPLSIMAISNLGLPAYQTTAEMAIIYTALVLPVFLGEWFKRSRHPAVIAAAALLPSFAFYVVSNFAVWGLQNMYAHTAAGLAECYVNGIPFYKWMLQGDLLFAALVFGGYALTQTTYGVVLQLGLERRGHAQAV